MGEPYQLINTEARNFGVYIPIDKETEVIVFCGGKIMFTFNVSENLEFRLQPKQEQDDE